MEEEVLNAAGVADGACQEDPCTVLLNFMGLDGIKTKQFRERQHQDTRSHPRVQPS